MELQQVVRLAKEAGFNEESAYRPVVQRFAELVAAAEREACAKTAEDALFGKAAEVIAHAIRARNERLLPNAEAQGRA